MPRRRVYQRLTKRARDVLQRAEGVDVEFKRSLSGLDASDLVAFANSSAGGVILVGVEEATGKDGVQMGRPIGCKIGDGPRLQIVNKAMECIPPLNIEIYVENAAAKPFFRIEIESGPLKPYCTPRGTYKIREDGRVQPLRPDRLLQMLLEREADEFGRRFRDATIQVEASLEHTSDMVSDMETMVDSKLEEISSSLGWAASEASDASSTISNVEALVYSLRSEVDDANKRARALLRHQAVPDPIEEAAKEDLAKQFREQLSADRDLLDAVVKGGSVNISGAPTRVLTQEQISAVLTAVCKELLGASA